MNSHQDTAIETELASITRHVRRSRLSRFWHNAGAVNTLIVLAWCALMSFYIVALIRKERWLELACCIVIPLVLAWPVSRLFIRYFSISRHVMNVWAIALIITHIAARTSAAPLPTFAEPAILAAVSRYIGTYFLVLSDWQITPSHE